MALQSEALLPPPKLMLATSIVSALAVTQSTPAMTSDMQPLPLGLRTLTAQMRAPGTSPTTPMSLSRAAIVPETWVPWPCPSSQLLVLAPQRVHDQTRPR